MEENKEKKKPVYNLDETLESSDWLRSMAWDLPTNARSFLGVIGGIENLDKFMKLPAAKPMPEELKQELADIINNEEKKK